MLDKASKYPYWTIFGVVLVFFSFLSFNGIYFNWWGDPEVYISVAQTMFHGGALYKDAVDIKNTGFLLSYYLMYYPYGMLFETKEFFHLWHATFLTALFLGIGMLSYRLASYLYDKKTSLFTAIVILMFMVGNAHSLFINQPHVAVFCVLCFLLYFHKTYTRQSKLDYFVYGLLLGVSFTMSHIYAPLVLIVPFLSIQKNGIKNIKDILLECCMAGVGFFIIVGMMFLYLYQTGVLEDWWFWAITYPQQGYLNKMVISAFSRDFNIINHPLARYTAVILSFFSIGNNIRAVAEYATYIHHFILGFVLIGVGIFVYKKYIKKQALEVSQIEMALLFFSLLIFWSRMLLVRVQGSDSYNIYLIPLMLINIPILLRELPTFKAKFTKFIRVCFVLCLIYIPFRYVYKPGIQKDIIDPYEKQLVILNPDKTPTVIGSPWTFSLYSTKWKYIFYNPNFAREYDFRDKIQELTPEVLILHRVSGYPDSEAEERFLDYLSQNYTKVSDYIYIYSDKLSTWILPE